jgi:N-acetyltransferase
LGGKFGIACPRRWGFESAAWHSPDGSEWVVVCDRRDHAKRRAVALKIAAHVERTLGMRAGWALENEKAKMFVRVAGDRAVGALIAEPVSGAFRTVPETRGDAIQHERENAERENANAFREDFRSITRRGDTRERATLGVRALWTHPARRRRGVASQLLATARHVMTAGYVSGERECAFTQPTDSGKRFARKACGREDGTFLVYLPE